MSTLLRAQASSAIATIGDLALSVGLTSGLAVAGPVAGAAGSVLGGAINFVVNRHWAYAAARQAWKRQAIRYTLVWCGHVMLTYALVRFGIDVLGLPFLPVKVITMVLLAVGWNHRLHRRYVFAS